MSEPADVTRWIEAHREGDPEARERLMEVVYPQLKRMARRQRGGRRDQTLDATALVNELYLRVVAQEGRTYHNRAHFFALASRAMRQIAIDYARRKSRAKRGGGAVVVPYRDDDQPVEREAERLLALDEALEKLGADQPDLKRVVECRFFGGLSVAETAEALGISERSVERYWSLARARLRQELG